jgi:hypothetical protein
MIRLLGPRFKLFFLFFAFGAGLTYLVGWLTQFHVLSNDYWNILYYGRGMTLSQPESLYNGFYPFGYAFLIGQMPFTYVLSLSFILNALLSGLLVASVSTLVSYSDSIPATLVAFYSSLAAPFIFQSAITLSPDIGAAAFTAFAVFLLCRDWFAPVPQTSVCDSGKMNFAVHPILAGISLGLSLLWRTHAIVSILAILAGYLLLTIRRQDAGKALKNLGSWRLGGSVSLIASTILVAGAQVIVNLISGHAPFETGQSFNLYKFFYGVDSINPPGPADLEGFSFIKTVMEDPARAFGMAKPFFLYFISHLWAAALAFLLSPKGRFARFSLFTAIFIILYSIPISFSDSARSPVILMGIYIASVAVLLAVITDTSRKYLPSIRRFEWIVAILFVALGYQTYYGWAVYDAGLVRQAVAERKVLAVIEQTLIFNGMTSPNEIFSDRYDFYTPNIMPYRSRQIGNWSAGWVWGYAEEFPELPNDSWESFAAACRAQGVRFLVLSQNSHFRGDIFPPIYKEEADIEALGLRFIGQRGKMRIYQFK